MQEQVFSEHKKTVIRATSCSRDRYCCIDILSLLSPLLFYVLAEIHTTSNGPADLGGAGGSRLGEEDPCGHQEGQLQDAGEGRKEEDSVLEEEARIGDTLFPQWRRQVDQGGQEELDVGEQEVRGCSQIMSAIEGGVWKMLTMADKRGRGGKANADNG